MRGPARHARGQSLDGLADALGGAGAQTRRLGKFRGHVRGNVAEGGRRAEREPEIGIGHIYWSVCSESPPATPLPWPDTPWSRRGHARINRRMRLQLDSIAKC